LQLGTIKPLTHLIDDSKDEEENVTIARFEVVSITTVTLLFGKQQLVHVYVQKIVLSKNMLS
jgi:hypothetical protein